MLLKTLEFLASIKKKLDNLVTIGSHFLRVTISFVVMCLLYEACALLGFFLKPSSHLSTPSYRNLYYVPRLLALEASI